MAGQIYAFLGVHGCGKSTVVNKLIEKYGNQIVFVSGDIADHRSQDLEILGGLRREACFLADIFIGLVIGTERALKGQKVLIDMPFEQILPYVDYWIESREERERIYEFYESFRRMFEYQNSEVPVTYILFDVRDKNGIDEIVHRIKERAKRINRDPSFVEKESEREYVETIIKGFKRVADNLRKRGGEIEVLDALAPIEKKVTSLEGIIFSNI